MAMLDKVFLAREHEAEFDYLQMLKDDSCKLWFENCCTF